MKASEVVERLTQSIDEHGDLDCVVYDDGTLREINRVEFNEEDDIFEI